MVCNKQNSKLCFPDMRSMSLRNDGDSVNNESTGLVVYRITIIPMLHYFHIRVTQFAILYLSIEIEVNNTIQPFM